MNKIKVISFYVARLFDILMIALPVYIIFQWIFVDASWLLLHDQYSLDVQYSVDPTLIEMLRYDQVPWTTFTRFLACCSQLIEGLLFSIIFYFLSKIFHRYEIGEIFTMNNAQEYYKIGKLLFLDALIAKPIAQALWTIAVTFSNPVGQRYIRVSIGTPNVMAVLLGLIVIFISFVMIEGSKIQDEQQLII